MMILTSYRDCKPHRLLYYRMHLPMKLLPTNCGSYPPSVRGDVAGCSPHIQQQAAANIYKKKLYMVFKCCIILAEAAVMNFNVSPYCRMHLPMRLLTTYRGCNPPLYYRMHLPMRLLTIYRGCNPPPLM